MRINDSNSRYQAAAPEGRTGNKNFSTHTPLIICSCGVSTTLASLLLLLFLPVLASLLLLMPLMFQLSLVLLLALLLLESLL